MNCWASLPPRLLASVILDGEVKSDRTSERHSLGVSSAERIFVQNRSSVVSSSGWSTCWGRRGGGIAGGPDLQGIFVTQGGTAPERLRARFIYSYYQGAGSACHLVQHASAHLTPDACPSVGFCRPIYDHDTLGDPWLTTLDRPARAHGGYVASNRSQIRGHRSTLDPAALSRA